MITPRKVKFEAKKRGNENIEFRTFLKCNADEKELDEQFKKLHEELFAKYDCSIPEEDLEKDAEYLGLTKEELINSYLIKKESENTYVTKHHPCDFLEEDGNCKLGEYKPENCRKYPYTDQPERLHSLYSVLETVEVCPIAFEIYERLKEEYGFRYRR